MSNVPMAEVPTIDISPLFGTDIDLKLQVARQIGAACRGSGFFYAANHGVDVELLQNVTNEIHRTMTDEEKFKLAIHAYNPNNTHVRNGYYMAIKGKKAVESFCYLNPNFTVNHPRIKDQTPAHEVNDWPDEVKHPGFRSFNEAYYAELLKVSAAILRGMALALGKEETFFDRFLTPQDTLSSVSLIRYPYLEDYPPVKIASDGTKLSFEQHLDVSLITVLFQSPVPNLQVQTKLGWQDIGSSGDNFLVNCGTYMAHITNNYFHAPLHRVKFINQERLSLPFFCNLDHDSTIEPFSPHETSTMVCNKAEAYGIYLQRELLHLIKTNGQT